MLDDTKTSDEATALSKIRCQVAGCDANLRLCGAYCMKRHICHQHRKADVVFRRGNTVQPWRFCHQGTPNLVALTGDHVTRLTLSAGQPATYVGDACCDVTVGTGPHPAVCQQRRYHAPGQTAQCSNQAVSQHVAPAAPDGVVPYWTDDPAVLTSAAVPQGRTTAAAALAYQTAAAPGCQALSTADVLLMDVGGLSGVNEDDDDSIIALLQDISSNEMINVHLSDEDLTEIIQAALLQAKAKAQQQLQREEEDSGPKQQQLAKAAHLEMKLGVSADTAAAEPAAQHMRVDLAQLTTAYTSGSDAAEQPRAVVAQGVPAANDIYSRIHGHANQPVDVGTAQHSAERYSTLMLERHTAPAECGPHPGTRNHVLSCTPEPNSFNELAHTLAAALDDCDAPSEQGTGSGTAARTPCLQVASDSRKWNNVYAWEAAMSS